MEASARITCQFLGLQEGDTALLCLPLDYIAGKMMVVRALTCHLRLVSTAPDGHPLSSEASLGQLWHGSDVEKPWLDFAAMVPLQVWNSLQVPEERKRLRQIRHLIIGGGAIDDALAKELEDFPHAVWSTYGMTETLSHIALRRLNGAERSSSYTPFEGVSVSLNAEGCLVIHAPAVCDRPLTTNDLAEMASDGRSFRILGRRDNVICSGGIKLQAEEIERKLSRHITSPYLITKRKDPALGEAIVMLVEDDDWKKYAAICQKVLTKYEQPKMVVPVDRIPMTETGKPARQQAEALASSLQGKNS